MSQPASCTLMYFLHINADLSSLSHDLNLLLREKSNLTCLCHPRYYRNQFVILESMPFSSMSHVEAILRRKFFFFSFPMNMSYAVYVHIPNNGFSE